MKKDIHPKWNKNTKVIVNGEVVMTVGSTLDEICVEVWSGNHPFYTGNMTYIDIDNRVQKYLDRSTQASTSITSIARSKKEKLVAKAEKKNNNKAKNQSNLTLKDMLKNIS